MSIQGGIFHRRIASWGLLVMLVVGLEGCTKLGQYYPSKTRGLAVATHDLSEASHRDVQALQQQRLKVEQKVVELRTRVSATEARAEVCEAEARALARGGAYSKVR